MRELPGAGSNGAPEEAEMERLKQYMESQRKTAVHVYYEMTNDMHRSMWQFRTSGASVTLGKESIVCKECMESVWGELVRKYFEKVEDELPDRRVRGGRGRGRGTRTPGRIA